VLARVEERRRKLPSPKGTTGAWREELKGTMCSGDGGSGGRQGPGATEAGVDRATHEQGRRGIWLGGPHLEERGAWATTGTRGLAEEKENRRGPNKKI
jgi:hypothetical protein